MAEKPAYCMHCRHAFEYDTDTVAASKYRYILVCPKCGKQNKALKEEYIITLESAGIALGIFLGLYFLFHGPLDASALFALIAGLFNGLTTYYFRVYRFKRSSQAHHDR